MVLTLHITNQFPWTDSLILSINVASLLSNDVTKLLVASVTSLMSLGWSWMKLRLVVVYWEVNLWWQLGLQMFCEMIVATTRKNMAKSLIFNMIPKEPHLTNHQFIEIDLNTHLSKYNSTNIQRITIHFNRLSKYKC